MKIVGSHVGPSAARRSVFGIVGAALLIASGAIHLDLYLTGYRTIPTIGWLFLLQVIAAFALAILIPWTGSWLAAAAGAGFALSVLGGYLLSLRFGLFGFTEVRTTAGIVSGVIDVAALFSGSRRPEVSTSIPSTRTSRRRACAVTSTTRRNCAVVRCSPVDRVLPRLRT